MTVNFWKLFFYFSGIIFFGNYFFIFLEIIFQKFQKIINITSFTFIYLNKYCPINFKYLNINIIFLAL